MCSMKNTLRVVLDRLVIAEEKIGELEEIVIKIIQNEIQTEKRIKTMNRALVNYGTTLRI